MATGTRELHLEEHIVQNLISLMPDGTASYTLKDSSSYNKDLCLIPEDLISFIKDTQEDKYNELYEQFGSITDDRIAYYAATSLKSSKYKTLDYFKTKLKINGQHIVPVYFKPSHNRSPEHELWYSKNRLTVVRQLKYSRKNANAIDLVLFLNGFPLVTIELKNALTGQYLQNAIKQYIRDRDPKEPLLEFKRCLVHFAVSTELVSMCTELKGKDTFFLPFNKGLVNENSTSYATSYLWEDVLSRDSLLDLLQNYVNIQVDKEKYYDSKTKVLREKEKIKLIFPRFHQRRAVTRLLNAVKEYGVGNKYLIQHSAGSGKSNTIAWLAHQLSGFHKNVEDSKSLFNSVIVVTDRRILNKQIQNSIRQFQQVPGSVVYIDESQPSGVLATAIENGVPIIVTTLQRFPIISSTIAQNREKTFAVLIDEAHSSQAGESARHLRKALSLDEAEKVDGVEMSIDDIIAQEIKSKGKQPNISFFAFTATPKPRTVELFGTEINFRKNAFDTYTMEQAIKEGFILDVLKNYISFKRYYKLIKRVEISDKEYERKKTVRLLSSYVDLQDQAIEKKSRIILEHFSTQTQNEIQGRARAMVVTRSRLHAVRFKRKFDDIMREMKLPYSSLVAFSGTVTDAETGEDYTMENMNNLGGKIGLTDALKLPQYRILIVANMYQTGFDEPLLHTMFVDKKLGGANSVQTLSRLNRVMYGKDSTVVLDFVNDPEMIRADFQSYYGGNYMELIDQSDPNTLYNLQNTIDSFRIILDNEIDVYARLFFTAGDHKHELQPILNNVVKRFNENLSEDQQLLFKAETKSFVRLYRFLAQIITFTDVQLEKYYVFLSDIYKKLPLVTTDLPKEVLEEVDLESYKLQHQFTTSLELTKGDYAMQGLNISNGAMDPSDEMEWLTKIIKVLNETYGLDLKEEDKIDFATMKDNIYANEQLMSFFNERNSKDNIKDKFEEEIDNELLNFINTKLELYNKLSEDKVNLMFKKLWFNDLYDQKVRGIFNKKT